MRKREKICPSCKKMLPYGVFVTTWGEQCNSGRYCLPCHFEREEKQKQARLLEREELIEKLQIVYGAFWRHYAAPEDFIDCLQEERDYCPYCGIKFKDVETCKFNGASIHLEHMDSLHRGGEHSIRNTVYCCGPCNIKKGRLSFQKWLEKLETEYQKLAREIYTEKHGHQPEDFVEGCNWGRGNSDTEMISFRCLEAVRNSYPTPIVDRPPSNQHIVITIDIDEQVKHILEEREKGER